jgi:hypothetical protein
MRFIFVVAFLFIITSSYAQNRRKKKGDMSEMKVTEMTDSDSLKAEMTLIDAEKEAILENYDKAYELFILVNILSPKSPTVNFKIADILTKLGRNAEAVV